MGIVAALGVDDVPEVFGAPSPMAATAGVWFASWGSSTAAMVVACLRQWVTTTSVVAGTVLSLVIVSCAGLLMKHDVCLLYELRDYSGGAFPWHRSTNEVDRGYTGLQGVVRSLLDCCQSVI